MKMKFKDLPIGAEFRTYPGAVVTFCKSGSASYDQWGIDGLAGTCGPDEEVFAVRGRMWRHRKSKGIYERIGVGRLQTDTPIGDMTEVVIYRGEDGQLWARPMTEFDDRFDQL